MNKTQISTFQFSENHSIRAFEKNGLSWFVAADVCKALEIQNPTQAIEKLDDDEKAMFNVGLENQGLFDSRIKEVNIINESGLYILILRSRNAMKQGTIQHKFRKWVTSEVLPQIRKTGSYAIPQSKTTLPNGLTIEQQDEVKAMHRQILENTPVEMRKSLAIKLWAGVKQKFGCTYKAVAPEMFNEVLSVMARLAVENGIETLHGEVLDKAPSASFNQTEFACHFVKLLNYAKCYQRIQNLLCSDPNSPKAKELLNYFQYSVNVNKTGFLFVFKPDVENDIQTASDFIHQYFQNTDLPMI